MAQAQSGRFFRGAGAKGRSGGGDLTADGAGRFEMQSIGARGKEKEQGAREHKRRGLACTILGTLLV